MGKLKKGSCTHCRNGEVFIDHDQYGWYESCLQCGYSRDLPDLAPTDFGWKPGVEKLEPENTHELMPGNMESSMASKSRRPHHAPVRLHRADKQNRD